MSIRALRFWDVALAATGAAALITEGLLRADGGLSPGAYVVALAAAAPLAWRTRAPLTALTGVAAGAIICAAAFRASWSASALVASPSNRLRGCRHARMCRLPHLRDPQVAPTAEAQSPLGSRAVYTTP